MTDESGKTEYKRPKYVHIMYRKNGQKVCYFRPPGHHAFPLPITIGSREFIKAYNEAKEQIKTLPKRPARSKLHNVTQSHLSEAVFSTMAQSGVYLLIYKGKVTYVGTSKNCADRIAAHRVAGRPFDAAYYIFAEPSERERLERILITQMNPTGNVRGRRSATK